jgi:peptidoglycan/LPS O-acetylase OafA/YrhL
MPAILPGLTEPSSAQPAGEPDRLAALDGLRGLAACVVVLCHVLIAGSPVLADSFLPTGSRVTAGDPAWWLLETPLRVIWAGQEAVIVFFVLSGFVLALPMANGRRFRAAKYYPRRFVRLYVPVWGAVLLAAVLNVAVGREAAVDGTWWLNAHARSIDPTAAIHDLTLVVSAGDYSLASALWSLHWEVLFSLLLPLYVWVARRSTGPGTTAALTSAALALTLYPGDHFTRYMPCFLFGTLLAFRRDELLRGARWISGTAWSRWTLPVLCLLAITAGAWLPLSDRASRPLVATGAVLAVVLAMVHPTLRLVLESRGAQWAGRRSFSLYLVHEPIVVTIAFLAGAGTLGPGALVLLAVPAALLAAEGFFRLVERPSLQLSRAIGR